jgi:glycosyltransferase involved in cell wall biosynthesis
MVSILLCTRNRGTAPLASIRAILASDYPQFELLVMDQSDDDATLRALEPLCAADARLRYFRLEIPGKPFALNWGLSLARGEILALTDDDCIPAPDWLRTLARALTQDTRLGCVFGQVLAAPHDPDAGYIPACVFEEAHTITQVSELFQMPGPRHVGIGACMALRKNAALALAGWDTCLGPGGRFGSGDDHDMTVRMLAAGYAVHFSPEARVVHYGFRPWKFMAADMRRYGISYGAAFAKFSRCGIFYSGSWRMLRKYLGQALGNAVRLRRPSGLALARGWVYGLLLGSLHPIERTHYRFRARPLPPAASSPASSSLEIERRLAVTSARASAPVTPSQTQT